MRKPRFEFKLKLWHWAVAVLPLALFVIALLVCGGERDRAYHQWQAQQRAQETRYQARLAKLVHGPSTPEKVREKDTAYRVLMRHGWKETELTQKFAEDIISRRNPKVNFWTGKTVQVPLPDRRSHS